MKDFSIPMALVDFLPVIFFLIGSSLLQRDLYNKMTKASFAFFSAGCVNVFVAGAAKAAYKLLYAAGVCDFEVLNTIFFPMQSLGFILAGVGMILMVCRKQPKPAALAVAPVVYKGTFLFVGLMVAGLAFMDAGLCYMAAKLKRKSAVVLFVVSFVCCLGMGYLSSKDFADAGMNWIAQGINTLGQGAFLAGAWVLHKAGLASYKMEYKK